MSTGKPDSAVSFNYSDRFSTLMLWWKAFFLLPVWAYPALPFVGSVVSFVGLLQFTYVSAVICGVLYLLNDILKRKITVDGKYIVHGFRARDLTQLLSIGTVYRRNEVLPKKMVLTFREGKTLEFRLSRINAAQYQKFLSLIDSKYSQVQIDPVLQTLISCRSVARKMLVDDGDRFIIEYKASRPIHDMWRAFTDTAYPWLRIGPIFVALMNAPSWLTFISTWLFMPLGWQEQDNANRAAGSLHDMCRGFVQVLEQSFSKAGSDCLSALGHPVIAAICFSALIVWLFKTVIKLLMQPNALIVDSKGLTLALSIFSNTFVCNRIPWQSVQSVGLGKKDGDGKAKISFSMSNAKSFDVELSAIAEHDRPRLTRALERFAPGCAIESRLSEAMMPRRDRSYTELWLQSLSTPPDRKSLQALAPGQPLEEGRYVVLHRLGVGGQGTAYLCRDQVKKVDVVLKETVIPVFADRVVKEQALKRFDHEAKMLQALDSDHIVKLRDHFFEDHRGYLVLEHISGKTLRQLVEEKGALSEAEIISMSQQMCLILAHLHERDIIHRDFTPDNLILTEDGILKLIDFNVAQSTAVGTTGTIAGKHSYLPPEQFRGKATKQSDIYAMGATLFYLAVGKDPEPISESSALKSGAMVSAPLDELMRGCTAIDCAKRYGSVADVEAGLRLCIADDDAALKVAISEIESATIDLRSVEKQSVRERDVTHG